jgi:hypothetical protein
VARKVDDQETMAVFVPRGMVGDKTILEGNRRRLSRADMHRKIGHRIRAVLAEACSWKGDEPPGDHRFVVFSVDPAEDVNVFIQFWSEPNDVVDWEVSSGEFHEPTAAWMPDDLAAKLRPFGLKLPSKRGRNPEPANYARTVKIESARDLARVARAVVDIFYNVFGYRGLTPIGVHLDSGGEAQYEAVYEAVTPDIICKLARRAGCAATTADEDAAPGTSLIRLRRKGVAADVVLDDDAGNGRYRSGFVGTPKVPRAMKRVVGAAVQEQLPGSQIDGWRVGTTLMFDGGVTAEWIKKRLRQGLSLIARSATRE